MKHTQEYHQQLLEVWHTGDVGFLPHRYRRCGFSGAGNCCCGRAEEGRLHMAASATAQGVDNPSGHAPTPPQKGDYPPGSDPSTDSIRS